MCMFAAFITFNGHSRLLPFDQYRCMKTRDALTGPVKEQSDQSLHCFPFCHYTLNTSSDQPLKYGQHAQIKKFFAIF